MVFCDNLLKSFSENLKQLTKVNDFLLFLRFHKNRRLLYCFHRRYEFCMQKYPSKFIFISMNFHSKISKAQSSVSVILSKAIALRFSRFSQKFKISNVKFLILLYLSSLPSKNNIFFFLLFVKSAQEFQ